MSKIAVIYWSGTGNTEAMAELVSSAARDAGAQVTQYTAAAFPMEEASSFSAFALGCPAMGAEQLEESEFEPMFAGLEGPGTEFTGAIMRHATRCASCCR